MPVDAEFPDAGGSCRNGFLPPAPFDDPPDGTRTKWVLS